jgi:hypothetical protein
VSDTNSELRSNSSGFKARQSTAQTYTCKKFMTLDGHTTLFGQPQFIHTPPLIRWPLANGLARVLGPVGSRVPNGPSIALSAKPLGAGRSMIERPPHVEPGDLEESQSEHLGKALRVHTRGY